MQFLFFLTTLVCTNIIESLYIPDDPQDPTIEVNLKKPMQVRRFEIWRRELNSCDNTDFELFQVKKGPSRLLNVIVVFLNFNEPINKTYDYSICIIDGENRHYSEPFRYFPKIERWFLSREVN